MPSHREVAIDSRVRSCRPPRVERLPVRWPLSSGYVATPTIVGTSWRLNVPGSVNTATKIALAVGPTIWHGRVCEIALHAGRDFRSTSSGSSVPSVVGENFVFPILVAL